MRLHIWQVNHREVADNQVRSLRDESLAPRFKSFPQCSRSSSGETQCWEPITRERLFCKSDISIKTHSCLTQHYRQNNICPRSLYWWFSFSFLEYVWVCVCAKGNGSTNHPRGYLISYASLSPTRTEGRILCFFCYDLHSRVNQVLASTAINF